MPECTCCHTVLDEGAVFCPRCGAHVEGAVECLDYRYEAFVSYRHLPHDTEVAKQIQRRIEGFRVPKDLDNPRAGEKLGRLFRDEDELPTSSSLSEQIADALLHSRFLIVVCTPDTPESRWVAREVELFSSLHGRDRVLVALAGAEPADSFPELLLQRMVALPDGTLAAEPAEPLAADFRAKGKYRQEALRITATIVGCGYDDLRQRQRARRNGAIAKIGAAVAAVAVAFAGFSAYQQAQIVENQRQLQASQSRLLAREADELLASGDRMQAVQAALTALPESSTSDDRPYVPEAQAALENALQAYPTSDGWYPCYSHDETATVKSMSASESAGTYAVLDAASVVHAYRIVPGEAAYDIDLADYASPGRDGSNGSEPSMSTQWSIAMRGSSLVAYTKNGSRALCFDVADGGLRWSYESGNENDRIVAVEVSESEKLVAIASTASYRNSQTDWGWLATVTLLDGGTGSEKGRFEAAKAHEDLSGSSVVRFDGAEAHVAATFGYPLMMVDIATGDVSEASLKYPICTDLTWAGKNVIVASLTWGQFEGAADYSTNKVYSGQIQSFTLEGEQRWNADIRLPDVQVGNTVFESQVRFWSSDADGNGSHKRVLASVGCDLVMMDTASGSLEALGTYESPVLECRVFGKAGSRRVRLCTDAGTVVARGLTDEFANGASADANVGATGAARFVFVDEAPDDVFGYLVTCPDSLARANTSQVRMFRMTDGAREAQGIANLYGYCYNCDGSLIAAKSDSPDSAAGSSGTTGSIVVLDSGSLDAVAVITEADLDGYDPKSVELVSFSFDDPNVLYLFMSHDLHSLLYAYDVANARVENTVDLDYKHMQIASVCAGNGAILVTDVDEGNAPCRVLIDPGTFEIAASFEAERYRGMGDVVPDPFDSCSNAWCDGSLLAQSYADGSVDLIDLASGQPVTCDFGSFAFSGKGPVMYGSGADAFAVGTNGSQLACFDLPSGAHRWSIRLDRGDLDYLGVIPDGGKIVVQASGILELIDASTGRTLARAASPLDPVIECRALSDRGLLLVRCKIDGDFRGRCALKVIDMDDATLAPKSSIDYGITLSSGADKVLVDDDSSDKPGVWTLPYLGLDDLIRQGRSLTVGLSPTDQERH